MEHREQGAAAVEFALVAMLLITLVFGGMEGGRLWFLQSTLAAGARDAAREVAINHHSSTAVELQAKASNAVSGSFSAVSADPVTVVITGDCAGSGDAEVQATANVGSMTGLLDGLLFGSDGKATLRGVGVMRCNG